MPESLSQILLLLMFIIPGFVLIRIKRLAYPTSEESTARTVLDSLALSSLVHGLCSPLWYWMIVTRSYLSHPLLSALFVFAILFAVPASLGGLYDVLAGADRGRGLRKFLGIPHPVRAAWDYHFRKGTPYWVSMTFKNGQVMAGLFGLNSFASSSPQERDLYLEQLLLLDEDGNVTGLRENSAGAIVRMDDLQRIEFIEIKE